MKYEINLNHYNLFYNYYYNSYIIYLNYEKKIIYNNNIEINNI